MKRHIFGLDIDDISFEEALARFKDFIESRRFHFVTLPTAQHITLLNKDTDFKKAYLSSDLILAVSMPVVFASKLLKKPLKRRIVSYELISGLLKLAQEQRYSIFILKGDEKEALAGTVSKLLQRFPDLGISYHNVPYDFDIIKDYRENGRILEDIAKAMPDILLAALSSPKQEKWIWLNRQRLSNIGVCMGIGGAIDLITGRLKPPPVWMRDAGLGWAFRLCQEPRRLWKRYLIGNPVFLYLTLLEILRPGRKNEKSF